MSQEGASFIVSDKLGHSVDKADLYDQIGSDVRLGTWEYFIQNSIDFDVLILDMDLSWYTEEVGYNNPEIRITELKEKFLSFFLSFKSDISYFLTSGDTVVILLSNSVPIVKSEMGGVKEKVYSQEWIESLSVLKRKEYTSAIRPTVDSDLEPVKEYYHAVSGHYEMELDRDVVREPDILARNPNSQMPAGVVLNEFIDETGNHVESNGKLILLPQSKSITKSHRIIEQLVELGWAYHGDERPESRSPEEQVQSMQLSMSIEQFDDELVEHCFSKYARGEYADAATKACKILENRLKNMVGPELEYSTTADLMKKVFRQSEGPLRMGEEPSEERGVMFLYSGAIQALRNPLSHRVVDPEKNRFLDDFGQQKAHDTISYVNLLLSLLANFEEEERVE